jgi:hypothetical protein
VIILPLSSFSGSFETCFSAILIPTRVCVFVWVL